MKLTILTVLSAMVFGLSAQAANFPTGSFTCNVSPDNHVAVGQTLVWEISSATFGDQELPMIHLVRGGVGESWGLGSVTTNSIANMTQINLAETNGRASTLTFKADGTIQATNFAAIFVCQKN